MYVCVYCYYSIYMSTQLYNTKGSVRHRHEVIDDVELNKIIKFVYTFVCLFLCLFDII